MGRWNCPSNPASQQFPRRLVELEQRHGSFTNYLRSHGGFAATMKDVRKQFKYMGDSGTYRFLYVVGEEAPPYEEYCSSR